MIAETGLVALWLATALALLQLILGLSHWRHGIGGPLPARAIAVGQGALTLVAFAALLAVFARTDLSVALVAHNSHSAKPLMYKIAGA